jgi:hypothetical protein
MKGQETDYLDKLFASSSDVTDEAEVELPLVEVPENLGEKLYAIAESTPAGNASVHRGFYQSWPKVTSIAASLFVAITGFQFYQQQQTFKQLEQAQADLATALHYLSEANRITQAQVFNSLNENMNKAGVKPAMEIGRGAIAPNFKQHEREVNPEIETSNRTY